MSDSAAVLEITILAACYASALAHIVALLGPDGICSCELPSDCGLPFEAAEALSIAKEALAGRYRDTM